MFNFGQTSRLFLLALALILSASLRGQTPRHVYHLSDPALARAAQAYDLAQESGDRSALEHLLADDYVLYGSSGGVTNKDGLIRELCKPGVRNNPFTVESPFVRMMGGAAILGGWVRLSGTDNGKPFEQRLRFADVWKKTPHGWQVTFTEVTPSPHP